MSESNVFAPPPGWYADPMGGGFSRWWDGEAWTTRVSDTAPQEPFGSDPIEDISDTVDSPLSTIPESEPVQSSEKAFAQPAVEQSPVVEPEPQLPANVEEPPAATSVPMTRRQLREQLGGPLTTGPSDRVRRP
jgi:hypothetical protein